jgi:uncharacterized protein (TIGR02145 family)
MKSYISVSANNEYNTIDEAFEKVFSSKNPRPGRGGFEPLSAFTGTELEGCKIWFPKFKRNVKGDFVPATDKAFNSFLSKDETEIKECLPEENPRKRGEKRITFAKIGSNKPYKFIGIFELVKIENGGKIIHHKRISDKCLIIKRNASSVIKSVLSATLAFALSLSLNACGEQDRTNDNVPLSSSKISSSSARSSSGGSVIRSSSSAISSSSINVQSSSSVGCEEFVFNPATSFCYGNNVYSKCNGMEYNPTTHICQGLVAAPAKCNGIQYNPLEQRCQDNVIETISSSSSIMPSSSSIVPSSSSSSVVPSSSSIVPSSSSACTAANNNATQYCSNGTMKNYGFVTYGGKTYKTVVIGTQTWMAENLNYNVSGSKCYAEGVEGVSADSIAKNCARYGRLYSWATAMAFPDSCNSSICASKISAKHKGICPSGWHIPNNADWNVLMKFVNPNCSDNSSCAGAGTKLKAREGWDYYPGVSGTDSYGFSALPGGGDSSFGNLGNVGIGGLWLSASEYVSTHAYYRLMSYNIEDAGYSNHDAKDCMISVRCLQD